MDNYVKNVGSNKMGEVKNVDNLWITQYVVVYVKIGTIGVLYRHETAVKCDID